MKPKSGLFPQTLHVPSMFNKQDPLFGVMGHIARQDFSSKFQELFTCRFKIFTVCYPKHHDVRNYYSTLGIDLKPHHTVI